MNKDAVFVLAAMLSMATAFSQNPMLLRPDIIPPSPDVVSNMKFVETNVSLFTGAPQISIPIYTVQEGNYSLPISLDYNAGGIKVSEIASWVGLGWSLSAGGMIGRSAMGLPDEYENGFLNVPAPQLGNHTNMVEHALGYLDNQPDMFYFRFAGHSGRFFFDKSGAVHTIPKSDFKIEKTTDYFGFDGTANYPAIIKWVVTTDDGIQYTFSDYEAGSSEGLSDKPVSSPRLLSINSWHLSKIEFPEGGMITFTYTTNFVPYHVFSELNMNVLYGGGSSMPDPLLKRISWLNLRTNFKRLSAINFSNGRVRFVKKQRERADLRSDYALDKIILENQSGTVLNQWALNYQIWEGTSMLSYETISISGNNTVNIGELDAGSNHIPLPMKRRLMLTGMKELNAAGVAKNSGYTFDYHHTVAIPHRFYPRTDFWGFANEAQMLKPFENPQVSYINGQYHIVNKTPDFNYVKQGALYKITHPTRGETHFEYELHSFSNGSMPGGSKQAGGLRTKKRTYYDPVAAKSYITNYYYTDQAYGLELSGTIMGSPVYYRQYRERQGAYDANYFIISSQSQYPLATRQGSYVAYESVVEERTDLAGTPLGMSHYTYSLEFDLLNIFYDPFSYIWFYNPDYPSLFHNSFPFPPADSRDWCSGMLISRVDYACENNNCYEVSSLYNVWENTINSSPSGYKAGIKTYDLNNNYAHDLIVAVYNVSTGTICLKQTIEKEKRGGVWVTRQKNHTYGESKVLPVHTGEVLESGKKRHQYFSYPKEYAAGSGFIDQLKTKNILNKPIEIVTAVENGPSFKITEGSITAYNSDGLPTSIKLLEIGEAVDKTQFRFSSMNGTGVLPGSGSKSIYTPDSRYRERVVLGYDRGRLYSHRVNDVSTYYLWGYNRQYPVAQITSDDPALNFKSKLTNPELTNVESGNYTTDNMAVTLDKIRSGYSSNPNVQVETFTFIPLRGIVDKITPNGIKTKNEYDSFGRLQFVKNHNGNTIEEYTYNYKN